MENKDFNEAMLAAIEAIAREDIIKPGKIPVSTYIQEAENLYEWCQPDKQDLTARGLDWDIVESIPQRAAVLRYGEAVWKRKRDKKEGPGKEWQKRRPELTDMRSILLHEFRFAFQEHKNLLATLDQIDGSKSYPSMLQDLNDLAVLGRSHSGLLEKYKFNLDLLAKAADLCYELGPLLAAARAETGPEDVKLFRDQAYTYLKWVVDVIYRFGHLVFWRTADRLKGYSSEFLRKMRRKQNKKKNKVKIPQA